MRYTVRMNDAIRAAANARLHEKHMSRADLARAVERNPVSISRALNGTAGGGEVPALWADILQALGLALVAVPVERTEGGGALDLQSGPAITGNDLQARITAAVREALSAQAAAGQPSEGDGGSAGGAR